MTGAIGFARPARIFSNTPASVASNASSAFARVLYKPPTIGKAVPLFLKLSAGPPIALVCAQRLPHFEIQIDAAVDVDQLPVRAQNIEERAEVGVRQFRLSS